MLFRAVFVVALCFAEAAAAQTSAYHVATNAALAASATATYPNGVWRDDFASGVGATPLFYTPLTGTCATNGLVSDGGSCVNTTAGDGNSWKAELPSNPSVLEWGADKTATYDAEPAIAACLAAVGPGGSCDASAGKFALVESLGIPAYTALSCGISFKDAEANISNWGSLPALFHGPDTVVEAAGDSATLTGCAVMPSSVESPDFTVSDFAGIGITDAGYPGFTILSTVILGYDTAIYITGGRPYIDHIYYDATGNSYAGIEIDDGNTDSGYVDHIKGQPLFTGNGNCTNSVRPGTGFRMSGSGGPGAVLGNVTIQNYETAQMDFEIPTTTTAVLWADNINGAANIFSFTGSISGSTMTVTSVPVGYTLYIGQFISGAGIRPGTYILSLGTGTGGAGTYNLSTSYSSIGSESIETAGCGTTGFGSSIGIKIGPNAQFNAQFVSINQQQTGLQVLNNEPIGRIGYLSISYNGGDAIAYGDTNTPAYLNVGTLAEGEIAGYAIHAGNAGSPFVVGSAYISGANGGNGSPYFYSDGETVLGNGPSSWLIGTISTDVGAGLTPFYTYDGAKGFVAGLGAAPMITGVTLSIASSSGLGTGTASLFSGSDADVGFVLLAPAGTPGSGGYVKLQLPMPARAYPACQITLANGSTSWPSTAQASFAAAAGTPTYVYFQWQGSLTAGQNYVLAYDCKSF